VYLLNNYTVLKVLTHLMRIVIWCNSVTETDRHKSKSVTTHVVLTDFLRCTNGTLRVTLSASSRSNWLIYEVNRAIMSYLTCKMSSGGFVRSGVIAVL
jgi:hypothetical protein